MKTIKIKSVSYLFTFLVSISFLALVISSCQPKVKSLPYLGEHVTEEVKIEGKYVFDTTFYTVPSFSLLNQDSVLTSENIVKDKVYVSYFFFTSCPATCPIMTSAMKRIHKIIGDHKGFVVLAHTVDPKRDTPEKLKAFSIKNEIDKDNWMFLTAPEEYIYDLGMNGYYLSMGKHDQAPGGFIHSSKFILLDKKRQIRGFYEGTDANEVAKLINGIQFLLNEED